MPARAKYVVARGLAHYPWVGALSMPTCRRCQALQVARAAEQHAVVARAAFVGCSIHALLGAFIRTVAGYGVSAACWRRHSVGTESGHYAVQAYACIKSYQAIRFPLRLQVHWPRTSTDRSMRSPLRRDIVAMPCNSRAQTFTGAVL